MTPRTPRHPTTRGRTSPLLAGAKAVAERDAVADADQLRPLVLRAIESGELVVDEGYLVVPDVIELEAVANGETIPPTTTITCPPCNDRFDGRAARIFRVT